MKTYSDLSKIGLKSRMPPPLPLELGNYGYSAVQVAVTWNDLTIVWCGKVGRLSEVYYHRDGKWHLKSTHGDTPLYLSCSSATVHDDIMYLMCGQTEDGNKVCNDIYTLDFNSWRWTKLNPRGTPPSESASLSTWLYNGKVYGFGGVGGLSRVPLTFFNQFFCYNISANCWEWPSASGIIPSPRAWHTTFICDNTAFLFGGLSNGPDGVEFLLNDLYTLDMVSMTWTQVNSSLKGDIADGFPEPRAGHSMTLISTEVAVLFGGTVSPGHASGDCWILNAGMVLRGEFETPSLWRRSKEHESRSIRGATRKIHSAVVEPISKRLWIIGGLTGKRPQETKAKEIVSITLNSGTPLKLLAMESALRYFYPGHPMLEDTELPKTLIAELENHRIRD